MDEFSKFVSDTGIDFEGFISHKWPVNMALANVQAKHILDSNILRKIDMDLISKIKRCISVKLLTYSHEQIIKRMADGDEIYLSDFCINPTRQNWPEKCCGYQLKKHPMISAVGKPNVILVDFSSHHLYIKKGNFYSSKDGDRIKSVDWVARMSNGKYLLTFNKYTKLGGGGSQGNQESDAHLWLDNVCGVSNKYVCVAVLDGDYYNEKKLSKLREKYGADKITNSKEIYELIDELNKPKALPIAG